jgi:putative hemolysin
MMLLVAGAALTGLLLSAFFSGVETGFYRATRLRLVLDALGGDLVSRGLVWLVGRPALFVATTLVGTNLSNYLVSLAVVVGIDALSGGMSHTAELAAPLVIAPLLFVYGELVPKNLFLQAPNRLLRRFGPLVLLFTVLFLPISGLLWTVDRLLQRLLRHSPEGVRTSLARRELRRILEEGHEAGILHPTQRALAQGLFAVGNRPVGRLAVPVARLPRARATMSREDVLGLAQRYRITTVLVEEARAGAAADGGRAAGSEERLLGYVRVIELALGRAEQLGPICPLLNVSEVTTHLAALMAMQAAGADFAAVVDAGGKTLGVVTIEHLRQSLLPAGKPS